MHLFTKTVVLVLWHITNKQINVTTLRMCIFPVITYICESWIISQTVKQKSRLFNLNYTGNSDYCELKTWEMQIF